MHHTVASALIVAAGYHAPLIIAVPIIAAVVILKLVLARRRGRPVPVGEITVRCRKGHVFSTTWSPLGSLTSIRLGPVRIQRCPVGDHWSLVRPVENSRSTSDPRSKQCE